MTKNIFDYSHVKSVSCFVLQDKQTLEIVGKIIANWSDNPAGSVCTAQVILYDFEKFDFKRPPQVRYESEFLKDSTHEQLLIGKAGGYGYDKISAAINSAVLCIKQPTDKSFGGVGESAVIEFFDVHGIKATRLV